MKELFERYKLYSRARGFADEYIEQVLRSIRFFDDFLGGNYDVNQVSADDFRRFISHLRDRPLWEGKKGAPGRRLSGTTMNTYARTIRAFFSWAKDQGIIVGDPLAGVPPPRKPKTIPKTYTEDEVRAIFAMVHGKLRNEAILFVFLESGVRLKEISQLTMINVDIKQGVIKVLGKGGKERYSYLTEVSLPTIRLYVKKYRSKATPNEPFFIVEEGHPLGPAGIQSFLARLGRKAGIKERLAPHKLRHTWATLVLKYGGNLEYLRKMAGHSDIKTTSNAYLNMADEDIKAAHQKSSPLSHLWPSSDGKEIPPGNVENITDNKASARQPSKKSRNSKIGSPKRLTLQTQTFDITGEEAKETAKMDNAIGLRLVPFFQDLYREHLRKLVSLTDELIGDIENGNLEVPQRAADSRPKLMFGPLKRVYRSQNNALWPHLLQHLDNEFATPLIEGQIEQIAAEESINKLLKRKTHTPGLIATIKEKLLLIKERGTLLGTCKICESYFRGDTGK